MANRRRSSNRRRRSRDGDSAATPTRPKRSDTLSLSFEEAAHELLMKPRTLLGHLKSTHAACLVPIGKRYRLDRKGFYKWCRRMGFESASPT